MSDGWTRTTWGELASLAYGKALRDYRDSGSGPVRVYGTNGPIGFTDQVQAPGPGVIIGRKGAYRGVHYSPGPFWVIDTAFYLVPSVTIDMSWAYYALSQVDINALDSGSAIPSTSREDVYALGVLLPPIDVQRRISRVLGALDRKIEVNRRLQLRCETAALALFEQAYASASELDYVALPELACIVKGVSYKSAELRAGSDTALVSLQMRGPVRPLPAARAEVLSRSIQAQSGSRARRRRRGNDRPDTGSRCHRTAGARAAQSRVREDGCQPRYGSGQAARS